MENLVKSLKLKLNRTKYIFKSKSFFSHKYSVVVNSIPKCGTNLILNIINSLPRTNYTGDFSLAATYKNSDNRYKYILSKIKKLKKSDVYSGHVPYSENFENWLKNNSVKQIFIYRNPRDYTVSLYHYIMKNKNPKHEYYNLYNNFENNYERLKISISGFGNGKNTYDISNKSITNVGIVFNKYKGWLSNSSTLSLRYEDIISINNDEEIIKFIDKILSFLEISHQINNSDKIKIFKNGVNPKKSHTFRKGKSGSWKEEYSDEHIKLFNENFDAKLLEKYNYSYDDKI